MKTRQMLTLLVSLAAVLIVVGCNRQAPPDPFSSTASSESAFSQFAAVGQVQFSARVETNDQNRLMLTFENRTDTVIALHNCQIVRLKGSTEAPIPFSDIKPGDSLGISGNQNQNGYVYATKLQLCEPGDGTGYDLAFRDTIVSIDYAAGTFMVKNHTQIIVVDENTELWGSITRQMYGPFDPNTDPNGQCNNTAGKVAANGNGSYQVSHDTTLVFSDLQVGNTVEVRANIVDEATLLAGKIKLVNCPDQLCVTFEGTIATLDVAARVVTFDALPWIGVVCPGAQLTGLDGESLTLADFAIGDYVSAKAFPLTGDTLKICQMEKAVAP